MREIAASRNALDNRQGYYFTDLYPKLDNFLSVTGRDHSYFSFGEFSFQAPGPLCGAE